MEPDPAKIAAAEKSAQRGCFFFTILASFIVFLLSFSAYIGFRGYLDIKKFTDDAPLQYPSQTTISDWRSIQEHIDAYLAEPSGSLTLTSRDLNALIEHSQPEATWRPGAVFNLKNEELTADISRPLNTLPFLAQRYFNGTLHSLQWNGDENSLQAQKATTADGRSIPEGFQPGMCETHFLLGIDYWRELLENTEKIEITRSNLLFYPKKLSTSPENGASAPK